MNMKKSIKFILLITTFVILLGFLITVIVVKNAVKPVSIGEATKEVRIEIPYGMSVKRVGSLLKEKELIRSANLFYVVARYPFFNKLLFSDQNFEAFSLKSGIYIIKDNLNIVQIQSILSSGQQEYIKISIPEGFTISKIARLLEENRICKAEEFIVKAKNSEIAAKFSIPGETVEGYLFPDTYFLTVEMDAESVMKIMIDNFYKKISTIQGVEGKTDEEIYEIVKLASVVEREYRVPDEAPLIASVFKNRLRRNIGLYSCATVEYIITEIEGRPHPDRILIEDTRIDNPYNTYINAGLPPGPISNPGLVSLDAAVNTPKSSYYFFQVVDKDAGRHVFSQSFEEHIENHYYTK